MDVPLGRRLCNLDGEIAMRPINGPDEGPGPDSELVEIFHDFEELCEIEGPGAADEGDLARLRQEMTDACAKRNRSAFLDRLAKAMLLRDGTDSGHFGLFSR